METENRKFKLPKKARDLTGQRFGKLLALEPVGEDQQGRVLWRCQCDCGHQTIVIGCNLTSGNSKSCGCVQREKLSLRRWKHGMSQSLTYVSWYGMIKRCEDPHHRSYPNYGGRGIKVCERWHSFENFLADMGERPKGTTLDRIDNNGNYCPGNCKWSTFLEQQRNKRPVSKGPHKQREFFAFNFEEGLVLTSNNQNQFARDHGLSRGDISMCLKNQRPSHKGWTFAYCPEG